MSEQMNLFNSNDSLSLLSKITILRQAKNLRATELLKDPESKSANNDWAFIVPACFNDALDIKKTLRTQNKKTHEKNKEKHKIWTQGSIFYFKTGDIFYNKKEAYTDWPKAISEELIAIQVVSGKSSVPGISDKNDKTGKDREKGEVTYNIYHGRKKENVLRKEAVHTTTQDNFIRILISGLELGSS
ncbi:MAG: hypothetical protein WBM07_18400 [Chitinivibrionales bacterium]